ncbi:hypothetical protein ACFS5M_09460 [Lacinutrix iliipiscaria]|uniref:YhhN-like protein n=1 Tax=Lacinutrix iliipiscaria TaxID=1230532 RepID=A0ABW5WR25_9FLAO
MHINLYSLAFFGLIDASYIFSVLELLIVPTITIYYLIYNKNKTKLFTLFLLCYAIADILHLLDSDSDSDLLYFLCNSLYVSAYLILLIQIVKTLNFRVIMKRFLIQTIVLLALVTYLFVVLCSIIDPIIFETKFLDMVRFTEHIYNLVLLLLLAVSFLNYLEKDTRKSLLLFIGCLAISNSEFILIGYYYLSDLELLSYLASALNILAFVMFYMQSNLDVDRKKDTKVFA